MIRYKDNNIIFTVDELIFHYCDKMDKADYDEYEAYDVYQLLLRTLVSKGFNITGFDTIDDCNRLATHITLYSDKESQLLCSLLYSNDETNMFEEVLYD